MATKRTKGSHFERQVATALSLWWSNGDFDDLAWRTSGSGGRATRRGGKRTMNHYGDIGPTSDDMTPFFRVFCVELKFGYSKYSPYDMLDSLRGPGQLGKWWLKLSVTTLKSEARWPLMVWRRNGKKNIVILPRVCTETIGMHAKSYIKIKADRYDLYCADFDDFLCSVSPATIRRLARGT